VCSLCISIIENKLRKSDPNRTHCEEQSRLGATIAVNKHYADIMYVTSTVPLVTVYACDAT